LNFRYHQEQISRTIFDARTEIQVSTKTSIHPTEAELDQLISAYGKKTGTFLQGSNDTGTDPGELACIRLQIIQKEGFTAKEIQKYRINNAFLLT